MKPRIVVVGSSNTDMVIQLDRLPRPGETILGGAFTTAAGGKGANQAVAAARAGGSVTFVARVGQDTLGDQALAGFARDGIDTRFVLRERRAPSGVALIFVARDGENCIAVAGGANQRLSAADLRRVRPTLRRAAILLLQLESPLATVRAAVRHAVEAGLPVILNPAPAQPLPDALLKNVTLLTPNETEAELLSGIRITSDRRLHQAANHLLDRGVTTVVLTLGARGALIADRTGHTLVPGYRVRAVDTVGAGDVFNGALAVALGEGQSLPDAVDFANAAAALSVTRLGAQPSAPNRRAIERLRRSPAAWLPGERAKQQAPGQSTDQRVLRKG